MPNAVIAPENPSPFVPATLADFFQSLAAERDQPSLWQGAGHFTELAENPTQPSTPTQRAEVQRLCAHPLLPKRDKTLNLLEYVRDNQERAAERIRQLQSLISQREDMRDAA